MNKTILLIDDDDDDKFIFQEIVDDLNSGYQCFFASDGMDGLQKLEEMSTKPDFIFIDLNMPKMGGKQCLSEIKCNPKFKGIPVIIYTTSKNNADKEETRSMGASYFLSKPGLYTDLHKAIGEILNGKVSFYKENGVTA